MIEYARINIRSEFPERVTLSFFISSGSEHSLPSYRRGTQPGDPKSRPSCSRIICRPTSRANRKCTSCLGLMLPLLGHSSAFLLQMHLLTDFTQSHAGLVLGCVAGFP